MIREYKCPYCGQDSYAKTSKIKGTFENWKAVRNHTSKCNKSTGKYFIDENEGSIHYKNFVQSNKYDIKNKFPNLKANLTNIRKAFKRRGYEIGFFNKIITKESIIEHILLFYKNNNRIPQIRDWEYNFKYPNHVTVKKYFGTWNKAIEAAGFTPNNDDGFGIRIKAKDGYLYRSHYETTFVNKFLYSQYNYSIEPKYPEPYYKFYDWYIPELNLYIELDGDLRPEVMKEKIRINSKLGRKLLVVKDKDINKFDTLTELVRKEK
jgi:hypothetical protein